MGNLFASEVHDDLPPSTLPCAPPHPLLSWWSKPVTKISWRKAAGSTYRYPGEGGGLRQCQDFVRRGAGKDRGALYFHSKIPPRIESCGELLQVGLKRKELKKLSIQQSKGIYPTTAVHEILLETLVDLWEGFSVPRTLWHRRNAWNTLSTCKGERHTNQFFLGKGHSNQRLEAIFLLLIVAVSVFFDAS